MKAGRPNISSIPAGVAFADALAAGLIARHGKIALPDILLLVPNRRAARALQDAFLRLSGGTPMLLPEMRPLGEIDEGEIFLTGGLSDDPDLPPAIPELRRLAILAGLVRRFAEVRGRSETPGSALRLAGELAHLMDQVETEGLSFDGLKDLAPEQYARHWQDTLEFLEIISAAWPVILAEQGLINPVARNTRLTNNLAEIWRQDPPTRPVIAAGSTGSIPATRALLAIVAELPGGEVVLPGLDHASSDDDWQEITETHPQFMMKALLEHMNVAREDVTEWGADWGGEVEAGKAARSELLRHALAPAAASANWRALDRDVLKQARRDIRLIDCPGPREEATAIALAMREALETPERRAALITPDRTLARRVKGELMRWGIEVDDSGGTPLGHTPPGTFLRAVLEAATEAFHPVPFLSLVKHPLSACGMARSEFLEGVRQLEVDALRGPRPEPGLKGLKAASKHPKVTDKACASLAASAKCLKEFEKLFTRKQVSFAALLRAHLEAAEALATTEEETGAARLWRGDNGEKLADFIEELLAAADDLDDMAPRDYLAAWDALIAGRTIRPRWGGHPRLHIWGALEARMQPADLVILGGLNEDTWPPAPASDPWMSREMRTEFGLPSPERRIGQSAHDFVQALGADDVLLTRSKKIDGTPTVPSRWLLRLQALIGPLPGGKQPWLGWCEVLAQGEAEPPLLPPRPTPPLDARPAKLPVSGVQEWMRDPYALYARRILRLRSLDPLDQPPGAADRGTIIHKAFETFFERPEVSQELPENALELLLEDGQSAFAEVMTRPAVWAFWWPRFVEIAKAFIVEQQLRAGRFDILGSEVEGEIAVEGTAAPFTLTAKADRIDRDIEQNELVIIDYKTGAIPQRKQIHAGYAPQLPLEGVIAEAGGFEGIEAGPVGELKFWKMQGGKKPLSKEWPKDEDVAESIERAREGLRKLIDTFANEDTPYLSRPRPAIAGGGDYDHLARVDEWSSRAADADDKEGSKS